MQKQPPRGVLKKRCSENMQQIYRRTTMPKCDFNTSRWLLLQMIVRGRFWFLEKLVWADIRWHLSNSIASVMPKFTSISSCTRASHSSLVSLGFLSIRSIPKLFLFDRSSNCMSFMETYVGTRRSCWTSLMFLSNSLQGILFYVSAMGYFLILVQKWVYIKSERKVINQNGVAIRKGKDYHRINVVFSTHF